MPSAGSIKRVTNANDDSQRFDLRTVDALDLQHGRGGGFQRRLNRFLNHAANTRRVVARTVENSEGDGSTLEVEDIITFTTTHGRGPGFQRNTLAVDYEVRSSHVVRIEVDDGSWIDIERADQIVLKTGSGPSFRREIIDIAWDDAAFDATDGIPVVEGPGDGFDPPWRLDPLQRIKDLSWAGNVFAIGGYAGISNGVISHSPDGAAFSQVFSGAPNGITGIAHGDGEWRAVSFPGGGTYVSDDGLSWTLAGGAARHIAFGYVTDNKGERVRDAEGRPIGKFITGDHQQPVFYAGGLFFKGENGLFSADPGLSAATLRVSRDGENWSEIDNFFSHGTPDFQEQCTVIGAAYGNGRWVVAGVVPESTSRSWIHVRTSTNGFSYSGQHKVELAPATWFFGGDQGSALAFGRGAFFLCGQVWTGGHTYAQLRRVMRSTTGSGWSTVYENGGQGANQCIAFGGGRFLMGGAEISGASKIPVLQSSEDGLSWSTLDSAFGGTFSSVVSIGLGR